MYPQDALQLVFVLSHHFKQAYKVYQAILTSQQNHSFDELSAIISQYKSNHSAMNQVILSYKKNYKDIKNAFSHPASNGHIEGTNHRIKQIGRAAYGYGNPHNYFFRIRLQLFNRHQIKANFMSLLTQKTTMNLT